MSLFDDLFGYPFWKTPEKDAGQPAERKATLIDSRLFSEGEFITIYDGKLYRIKAEEIDLSSLKTKKRPESTSPAEGGAQRSEQ
jgi:hypothetical protein